MDIKNIIKNLHPLEIKVLLKYSGQDELTSEKLQKELDYKEGHANQAFSAPTARSMSRCYGISTISAISAAEKPSDPAGSGQIMCGL